MVLAGAPVTDRRTLVLVGPVAAVWKRNHTSWGVAVGKFWQVPAGMLFVGVAPKVVVAVGTQVLFTVSTVALQGSSFTIWVVKLTGPAVPELPPPQFMVT